MFVIKPLILIILVQEDRYGFPLSIGTKNVPIVHIWLHSDVLMTKSWFFIKFCWNRPIYRILKETRRNMWLYFFVLFLILFLFFVCLFVCLFCFVLFVFFFLLIMKGNHYYNIQKKLQVHKHQYFWIRSKKSIARPVVTTPLPVSLTDYPALTEEWRDSWHGFLPFSNLLVDIPKIKQHKTIILIL